MDRVITLRECLSLGVFSDAEIVACPESFQNSVACISVLDAHFNMDFFKKANTDPYLLYMVSDDILLQPNHIICESIDLIVEKKGAGLIIFTKQTLSESMPKIIREYALHKKLPIIGLKRGRDISFGTIIQNVMNRILTGAQTNDTVQGFFDALLYRLDNYTTRQKWISFAKRSRIDLIICVLHESGSGDQLSAFIKSHFQKYSIPSCIASFQNNIAVTISSPFADSAVEVLPELVKNLSEKQFVFTLFYTELSLLIQAERHTVSSIAGYFPYMRAIFPHKAILSYSDLVFTIQCRYYAETDQSAPISNDSILYFFKEESVGKLDLINTLAVWMLDAGRNTQIASEILNVHPNTLQYRLKRIKELTSIDIEDTPSLAVLSIALGIMRIKNNMALN